MLGQPRQADARSRACPSSARSSAAGGRRTIRCRPPPLGTDDFIALANDVSGEDLTDFLSAWVYGDTVPPMPGHPDWTSDPVTSRAERALSAAPDDSMRELELPRRQGGKRLPRY